MTQWFLCLFVNTLPTELTLRVLDCFLFEGNKVLLRVALGIFKCYESEILKTESFEDLFLLIAKPIQIQNADDFMTLIFDRIWLRAFGREKLAVLRQNVKKVTMEEEAKKTALRRSRTNARLEAAAKEAIRAVEAEAALAEAAAAAEASSSAPGAVSRSSPRSPASPRSPDTGTAPISSTTTSAATIRADITGTSPSNRGASRFDPAKRQTIRISALPDDVQSVVDRRSWRAYKRSEEWHMIEEYFNSMEWAESNPMPPVSPTRPDSGSRTPLSVTDPESVPKASKTKLYKAHTVTSATSPHVPVIAAPKISAARAQASRSPTTASPTSPVSPKSPKGPITPTMPSSTSNGNESKRRSYADVAKSGIDASESSSSSTDSPRGPPVQPVTQRKFVAATGGHGRSVSNASPMSPKKSTISSSNTTAGAQHRYAAPINAGAAPPPRVGGANERPPPNAERKWSARQGFNTLGKNISSLVSSLTKASVSGTATGPNNGETEPKPTNGTSTATSSSATKPSPPWTSGSPPTTAGPAKVLPSGPTVPATARFTRQPTLNQGATAKLPTSLPTTPAPTPPPPAGKSQPNNS